MLGLSGLLEISSHIYPGFSLRPMTSILLRPYLVQQRTRHLIAARGGVCTIMTDVFPTTALPALPLSFGLRWSRMTSGSKDGSIVFSSERPGHYVLTYIGTY